MGLNKAELTEAIAAEAKLSKADAKRAVNAFVTSTTKALKKGERVALVGFGTFSITKRAARKGRNPQTGKEDQDRCQESGEVQGWCRPLQQSEVRSTVLSGKSSAPWRGTFFFFAAYQPMTDQQILSTLAPFVSDNKRALFDRIAALRTRHVTVVLEDVYQSQNASAVVRTSDLVGIQDIHVIENRNKYQLNPSVTLGCIEVGRHTPLPRARGQLVGLRAGLACEGLSRHRNITTRREQHTRHHRPRTPSGLLLRHRTHRPERRADGPCG